ncbi:hypothetical protein Tco_0862651 [Tanacetum coccineum]
MKKLEKSQKEEEGLEAEPRRIEESEPFEQEESEPEEQEDLGHEVSSHRTATPPPPPASVIPPRTQPSPYRRQTARIRVADFLGPSSADPYVTATRESDRYTWQGHMDQYMQATEPRPPMAKSSHILLRAPMGYASGLNQFEQNRICNLTEVANTNRY